MVYVRLVEPGEPAPERIAFHVSTGTTEREIAEASYQVLLTHDPLELMVDDRFAGALTMSRVLPLLLSMDNVVRGHATRGGGRSAVPRDTRMPSAEVIRCRCRACGAIAFVLGRGVARCRMVGHGPMVPLSVG